MQIIFSHGKPEVTDSVAQLKDELVEAPADASRNRKEETPKDLTALDVTYLSICFITCPYLDKMCNQTLILGYTSLLPRCYQGESKTHQIMPLIKPDHAFDKRFNTRHIGQVQLAVCGCNGPTEPYLLRVNRICEPMSSYVRPARPRRM